MSKIQDQPAPALAHHALERRPERVGEGRSMTPQSWRSQRHPDTA